MWTSFYSKMSMSSKNKDFVDYIKSPYYAAFNRFANYCIDTSVINYQMFADWLLKNNVPIDKWSSDSQYSKFLIEFTALENPYDAIKRSIEHMMALAEGADCEFNEVFTKIHPNKICNAIISGKISPWVLYKSDSGIEWMSSLDGDQFGIIFEYVNPVKWGELFKIDKVASDGVGNLLKEMGL